MRRKPVLLLSEDQWDFYEEAYSQNDYSGRVVFHFQSPIMDAGYQSMPFKGHNVVSKKFRLKGYKQIDIRDLGNDLNLWRKALYKEIK